MESFIIFPVIPLNNAIVLFIDDTGPVTLPVAINAIAVRVDPSRTIISPTFTVPTGAGNVPAVDMIYHAGDVPTTGNVPTDALYAVGIGSHPMFLTLIATLPKESSTNFMLSLSLILI